MLLSSLSGRVEQIGRVGKKGWSVTDLWIQSEVK